MEEPERMIDQNTSPLARALLHEGRAYRAPDHVRKHTLVTLGVAASTGIVGTALAWISARSITTKAVMALSAATVLTAIPIGYTLIQHHGAAAPVAAPVAPDMPVIEPAPSPATVPAPIQAPAPERVEPTVRAAVRAPVPSSSALRDETAALDAARSRLANNDPAGALASVSAYFRSFPHGRLQPEAEVLRIDALAKAGHTASAQRHAREFLKRHPNSLLTARVRPYAEP